MCAVKTRSDYIRYTALKAQCHTRLLSCAPNWDRICRICYYFCLGLCWFQWDVYNFQWEWAGDWLELVMRTQPTSPYSHHLSRQARLFQKQGASSGGGQLSAAAGSPLAACRDTEMQVVFAYRPLHLQPISCLFWAKIVPVRLESVQKPCKGFICEYVTQSTLVGTQVTYACWRLTWKHIHIVCSSELLVPKRQTQRGGSSTKEQRKNWHMVSVLVHFFSTR